MITSIFIVLKGNVNPVFPSLPMHTLLSSKFPKEILLCLLFAPACLMRENQKTKKSSTKSFTKFLGEIQKTKAYLIENHRHNYGQCLTTPSRTHIYERSLCQFLFRNHEHFNCGIKSGLCACLKRMNTEMCFCACVYMKSVHPTIIRQSNCIEIRPTHHARYPR